MRSRVATWLQYQEGLLSDSLFASFSASWEKTLSQHGVRALWRLRRGGFEAGFAAFMDALIARTSAAPPTDFLAAWKAEVAKEEPAP